MYTHRYCFEQAYEMPNFEEHSIALIVLEARFIAHVYDLLDMSCNKSTMKNTVFFVAIFLPA